MQAVHVLAPAERRAFWQEILLLWGFEARFGECGSPLTICDNADGDYDEAVFDAGRKLFITGKLPQSCLAGTETVDTEAGELCYCPRLESGFDGFLAGDALLCLLDFFLPVRTRITATRARVLATAEAYVYDAQSGSVAESGAGEAYPALVRADGVLYTPFRLSDHAYVLQPTIPFFEYNPYVVKNHALARFFKALLVTLCPELEPRELWPGHEPCAVSITGDVHDYTGIAGREDREYMDMKRNSDLLKELGLEGRAAWFCSAYVAARHPEAFREMFARGYEIQPHTYIETQYSLEKWSYAQQNEDLRRCHEAFEPVSGGRLIYKKGFRTHGYQSNEVTREVLDAANCRYLADLQAWETRDNLSKTAFESGILYFGLPQQACGRDGRPLRLIEIPDTVPNDHTLYRLFKFTPEQSFDFWKSRFDRIRRLGGYFQTCLHPYISLFEEEGRKEVYVELLRYMKSQGAAFLLPIEVADLFWKDTPRISLF